MQSIANINWPIGLYGIWTDSGFKTTFSIEEALTYAYEEARNGSRITSIELLSRLEQPLKIYA